jgi:uncharacterized protein YjiS (DUF1127 family)
MTTITLKYLYQDQSASLRERVIKIWKIICLWNSRSHQRRQLARLSTEQLLDIGITLDSALAESSKPFWRT